MKNTRTQNSIFNFITGVGGQVLTTAMEFVVRTVFISTLGKTMLGINGLFSNILTMLSLAELGVGNAILFKLYDPIARNDQRRISVLMKFYKKMYFCIGLVITAISIVFIPFLPYLIKDYQSYASLQLSLTFIYLLFVSRTVSSYFFLAYKSAIIKADQKEYVLNIISYAFTIATAVFRIVAMYIFPSFEVYMIISIVFTILQNIAYAWKANQMFPFLKRKETETLSKEEQRNVFKDCGALMIYRLNGVVLTGTDNIIISTFLGLDTLGVYTNYYLFYKTIKNVFSKTFGAVAHSLGNLHATSQAKHEYDVFERLNLITAILAGTGFIGIAVVGDEFIKAWIGSSWMFKEPVAFLLGLEIYTLAYRELMTKYRNSMGLFRQAKYRPLAGMVINLVVSLILVQYWGVCGVAAGTIIADWTTFMWFDPIIIHKYGFGDAKLVKRYFLKFLKYFAATLIVFAIDSLLCRYIVTSHNWLNVILHAAICVLTEPAALILASWNTDERKYATGLAKKMTVKVKRIVRK